MNESAATSSDAPAPVYAPATPALGRAMRPWRRAAGPADLGGVCAGLAVRLGVRVRTVRVLWSLSVLFFGLGAVAYVTAWVTVVRSGEHRSILQRLSDRRADTAIVCIALVVVAIAAWDVTNFRLWGPHLFIWSLAAVLVGLVAVWRGASPEERVQLEALINEAPLVGARASSRRAIFVRVILGGVLVAIGVRIIQNLGGVWGEAVPTVLGVLVVVLGGLIVAAPWWLRMVRDLSSERRERIRAEERSRLAAHVHDSVLQALTLIERAADNPSEVVRLARSQERDLRDWLFEPAPARTTATFVGALRAIQSEVERNYGVRVEVVTVGDGPLEGALAALVAAGKESAVNAARWSGADTVSIYGEIEPARASLFVRDTGRGFDASAVPIARRGIEVSIRQRLAAVGGEATIRSAPDHGTEVELVVPLGPSQ